MNTSMICERNRCRSREGGWAGAPCEAVHRSREPLRSPPGVIDENRTSLDDFVHYKSSFVRPHSEQRTYTMITNFRLMFRIMPVSLEKKVNVNQYDRNAEYILYVVPVVSFRRQTGSCDLPSILRDPVCPARAVFLGVVPLIYGEQYGVEWVLPVGARSEVLWFQGIAGRRSIAANAGGR